MNELNMDPVFVMSFLVLALTIISFLGFAFAKYIKK